MFIADIPLFLWIGKRMFGSWAGFWDQFKWNFVPDVWSLLTGRFLKDILGETKAEIYLFICVAIFIFEVIIVVNIL